MKKLILIAILFALLQNSCKKNGGCKCGINYQLMPEATKEWFWFGQGSKWVYRLAEDTTVIDTMTIVGTSTQGTSGTCDPAFSGSIGCSDVYSVNLRHSNKQYFPGALAGTASTDTLYVFSPLYSKEQLRLHRQKSSSVFFATPPRTNENYKSFVLQDTIASFTINKVEYKDAFHSKRPSTANDDYITDIWWAKHIGLLKIIKTDGLTPSTTWELVSSEIK